MLNNFSPNLNIVVIGASGGIGSAFVEHLCALDNVSTVHALSRSNRQFAHPKVKYGSIDLTNEESIQAAAEHTSKQAPLDIIIVATGILHSDTLQPEKAFKELNAEKFETLFALNTIGPALVAKHFLPHIPRDRRSVFAAISARVGSISDNHLGGWYSYRASKAALNMLIKTTSIEIARKYKQAAIIGLHPGTVDTDLSKPFQSHVKEGKLFTAEYSAECLLYVINNASAEKSGKIFAWDGEEIPY